MNPHGMNLKGLSITARFIDDIMNEWKLCTQNQESLEYLSCIDTAFLHNLGNMDEKMVFPKLKDLQLFLVGEYTMNFITQEQFADWSSVKRSLGTIQQWLLFHSFPALERIQLLWSSDISIQTIDKGGIDGYDKDGPLYDVERDYSYISVSMDAVMSHYGSRFARLDLSWMNSLPVKTVHLASAMYDIVDDGNCKFEITSTRSFTQAEENEMFEKFQEY